MRFQIDGTKHFRELEKFRKECFDKVSEATQKVRVKFISPIAGQEMIYQAKELEARKYVTELPDTLEEYPFMAAEVGKLAETPWEVAQIWLFMGEQWRLVASSIEGMRTTANKTVESAQTKAEMEQAVNTFCSEVQIHTPV